tara:strand:- start:11299 stop:11526 length:228 start_codon:yes stop_codon:yes gene_type:complete
MNKQVIISIVLGVLILISVVQALQLNGIKGKISSGEFSTNSKSTSTPVASGGSSGGGSGAIPANINDLPQMVGGC